MEIFNRGVSNRDSIYRIKVVKRMHFYNQNAIESIFNTDYNQYPIRARICSFVHILLGFIAQKCTVVLFEILESEKMMPWSD